ncbi:ABC transporter permease [Massilia sp. CF038]|uniref:ABC transporter permease n=1 Tax=Massilia sp. CF038 TaxID=1881045 RepID=UPI00091A71E9|nr:ABC transporter permease [Massilia sp. CF038]SHG57363.1 putative ABC transport system permease protein [Massilia sp. CF038]
MFRNYLLTAWKVFMRRKLFTAINLLCIVLTLVVLMVVTALVQNAFYPTGVEGKSERFLQVMVMRTESDDASSISTSPLGYKVVEKYLKPMKSVELVGVTSGPSTVSVYQEGRVTELEMRRTDANYWKILDFTVLEGRLPNAEDDAQGRFVAVINRASALKLFGQVAAVGKSVRVSGQQFSIIGVVENEMQINAYADLWAPISTYPSSSYRQEYFGDFIALLLARSSADLPMVRKDVEAIASGADFGDKKQYSKINFWADSKIDALARQTIGHGDRADSGAGTMIAVLLCLMFLFMLLPALNLVNLNSGRILERSSEIGVRKAFGATSAHLVGQLLVENVLLCLAGGLISMAGAALVLQALESSDLIPYLKVHLNFAILGYGLLMTLFFGLLSGVLPAWKMSRLDPIHALKGAV